MFHRTADDEFNNYGLLRIDLQSNYENQPIINEILEIVNENFYKAFDVNAILTKAIPDAVERIASLERTGYQRLARKLMIYDDYFVKLWENISGDYFFQVHPDFKYLEEDMQKKNKTLFVGKLQVVVKL